MAWIKWDEVPRPKALSLAPLRMVELVRAMPALRMALLSGLGPGLLERALTDADLNPGTMIIR